MNEQQLLHDRRRDLYISIDSCPESPWFAMKYNVNRARLRLDQLRNLECPIPDGGDHNHLPSVVDPHTVRLARTKIPNARLTRRSSVEGTAHAHVPRHFIPLQGVLSEARLHRRHWPGPFAYATYALSPFDAL